MADSTQIPFCKVRHKKFQDMVVTKAVQICDTASESSYDSPCNSSLYDGSLDQEKSTPTRTTSSSSLHMCSINSSDCRTREQQQQQQDQSVSFGDVEIRKYRRILGDHPDVSVGPPISLDWDYNVCRRLSVEKYETCRKKRRHGAELMLSNTRRWIIIENLTDSTHDEIQECIKEVHKVQSERRKTAARHTNPKLVQGLKNLTLHFKKGHKKRLALYA